MSVTDQLEAALPDGPLSPTGPVKKKSIWQLELTKKKVPRKDLMHFSRQLAVFIKAGIPIIDALEVITEEMGDTTFRGIVEAIIRDLQSGDTFAIAAGRHPDAFPPFYLGILESAELTGQLDDVLVQLSGYLDRDLQARSKITSAMAYPLIVLGMSVVVVVILVSFVLPRFEVFFRDLHAKLPLPTRMLLGVAGFLTDWWFLFTGGAVLIVVSVLATLRTARGKAARDALLLKLPVIGDLITHVVLERFCRILGSMMVAGVPLPDALKVTATATSNAVYAKGLEEARQAMMRGEGLAGPLAETGLFPASARQMFRVGESTGTLDQQLDTAATYFERELDYKITRFTNLFEPAVLIFVGLVVGFVAIALVSAMYGIFSQANTVS
jgi:type IV pilus assembly protein PilC